MPYSSKLAEAQAEYDAAVAEFKRARDRVSAAKRELRIAEGKAVTTEQRDRNRLSARRAQVLRKHPELRKITNRAKRREAIDAILAKRDAPRVWKFYLDDMQWDQVSNTRVIYRRNPKRFKLYTAALTVRARLARQDGRPESIDTARTLELHLQSLVDASPREVTVHYPNEWRVISAALRPEGSSPKGDAARRLLSLYQHIIRTHTESLS